MIIFNHIDIVSWILMLYGGVHMNSTTAVTIEKKRESKRSIIVVTVLSLIVVAAILNQVSTRIQSPFFSRGAAILRTYIYFGLFSVWGLSVRRRIMQKQVRSYLGAISMLIILWLSLRTIKYYFVPPNLSLFRYLWYGYYIPMLLILVISLFIALSLGKPEDYLLPKWINIFYIPTLILILLVLTNDSHQLVFRFSEGIVRNGVLYKHNIVFWIIFAWLIICASIAIVVMFKNSKIPGSKKFIWLPFVPLIIDIAYTFMYVRWSSIIEVVANDMTIVHCLVIVSTFEFCIYTGLIRSNKHYESLFYTSSISGLIADENYNIIYKSENAQPISTENLKRAIVEPVNLNESTRLSSLEINGGYAFWLEDVSEMNTLLTELREVGDSLSENNELLQAELDIKEKKAKIQEKERLHNKVIEDVKYQLEMLSYTLSGENQISTKDKLMWASILGAYIKRRSNLIIISEESQELYAKEIEYSFREFKESIAEIGIDCYFNRKCQGKIPTENGILIYDIFEEIIERTLTLLKSLLINLNIAKGEIKLKMQLDHSGENITKALNNIEKLNKLNGTIVEKVEDETVNIIVIIPKGGKTK